MMVHLQLQTSVFVFLMLSFLIYGAPAVGIVVGITRPKNTVPKPMRLSLFDRTIYQQSSGEFAIIKIFSEGDVEVFVNAVKVLSFNGVGSPRRLQTVHLRVNTGDIIAVSSSRSGDRYGLLMDVQYDGNQHYAGRSSQYKSEGYRNQISKFYNAYKTKDFSSCSWGSLEHVSRASVLGVSDEVSFVWKMINGVPAQQVLIRFIVGGESCDSSQVTCSCREVPNISSYCYRMNDGNVLLGKCRKEKCEKYECIPGAINLLTCIRRFGTLKTVRKGRFNGFNFCEKENISPPIVYWVPYV